MWKYTSEYITSTSKYFKNKELHKKFQDNYKALSMTAHL